MEQSSLLARYVDKIPAPERKALRMALTQATAIQDRSTRTKVARSIAAVAITAGREAARRSSNRKTEPQRRALVGARINRETAKRYKQAAQETGRSLYRFTCDALSREYLRYLREREQNGG